MLPAPLQCIGTIKPLHTQKTTNQADKDLPFVCEHAEQPILLQSSNAVLEYRTRTVTELLLYMGPGGKTCCYFIAN